MHDISNLKEDKCDEVIEDLIAAPLEEDIGDEKSNEGTQTSISSSLEDKGLINHFPSQISGFNNAFVDDLERADFVKKGPLKIIFFPDMLIPSCEEEQVSQEHGNIEILFQIGGIDGIKLFVF